MPTYIFSYLKSWYQISLLKTSSFQRSLDNFRYNSSDPASIEALGSLINNNLGFDLYEHIDRLKIALTDEDYKTFNFVAQDIDITLGVSREDFEDIISEDLRRIDGLIDSALTAAGVRIDQIDTIITTGGSSLIPVVKQLLEQRFGATKIYNQDVFTSVARGLAVKAGQVF